MPENVSPSKLKKLKDRCFIRNEGQKDEAKVWIDRAQHNIRVICRDEDTLVGDITRQYGGAVSVVNTPSLNGTETWLTINPAPAKKVVNPKKGDGGDEASWTLAKNQIIEELTGIIQKHGYIFSEKSSTPER